MSAWWPVIDLIQLQAVLSVLGHRFCRLGMHRSHVAGAPYDGCFKMSDHHCNARARHLQFSTSLRLHVHRFSFDARKGGGKHCTCATANARFPIAVSSGRQGAAPAFLHSLLHPCCADALPKQCGIAVELQLAKQASEPALGVCHGQCCKPSAATSMPTPAPQLTACPTQGLCRLKSRHLQSRPA